MTKKRDNNYDSIDSWLLSLREEELKTIEEEQLSDVKVTRDSYMTLFNQGLELIRRERLPKALTLEILDQYAARLEDLQGVDLTFENINNYDDATREKIKSLILFGIQSVLINDNARLIAEITQSNKNYEELIGLITHEFKNMLTSIYGYNKILKRQLEKLNVVETSELVSTIERLTLKLFNIIDSLLKMSLGDRGEMEPQKKMIELKEDILLPVYDELAPLLKKKKMILRDKLKPKKIIIMADDDLLQMVFRNLIENAMKYGRDGTDILIDIKSDKKKMYVTVRNKGIGIPEEIRDNIFDKFKHASVGENKSGTGIGLYNVKNIIAKHGGTISCVSTQEKWTEFKFDLPLNPVSTKALGTN